MKRVTTYINTLKVSRLAEELIAAGIKEIRVIEHFSPTSQISRLQLYCEYDLVDKVREIIRQHGSNGSPPSYDVAVSDFDPDLPSQIPIGKRMSVLEEPHLARRIRSLFKGASTRLTVVFLAITLSIGVVGMFTNIQLERYQREARESAENVRMVVDAAGAIQVAHLEELLAAERLHRGEGETAMWDFKTARENLGVAVKTLHGSRLISRGAIDSLVEIENRFQSITDAMFGVLMRISNPPPKQKAETRGELSQSHAGIMVSLNLLHRKCVNLLASLERDVDEIAQENVVENNNALNAIRISLILLAIAATIITIIMWIVTRSQVSKPLGILVEEAWALDDAELR
ncbi:MAG: hypothetical protein WDA22_10730 [Bacteroidota bacterium]